MYRLYSSSFSAIGRLTDRCSTFYENKEKSFNYQVFFRVRSKKKKEYMEIAEWKFPMKSAVHGTQKLIENKSISFLMPKQTDSWENTICLHWYALR